MGTDNNDDNNVDADDNDDDDDDNDWMKYVHRLLSFLHHLERSFLLGVLF